MRISATGWLLPLFLAWPALARYDDKTEAESKQLQGTWSLVSMESSDNKVTPEEKLLRFTFEDDKLILTQPENRDSEERLTFTLDTSVTPHRIDLITPDKKTLPGIYQFKEGRLILCVAQYDDEKPTRPKAFAVTPDSHSLQVVLERLKPKPGKVVSPAVKAELERLQGSWRVVAIHTDGMAEDFERKEEIVSLRFNGDAMELVVTTRGNGEAQVERFPMTLDPSTMAPLIDLALEKDRLSEGIYQIKGDELRLCVNPVDMGTVKERPVELVSKEGTGYILVIARREKP
jgi:uncharacterized protein (TIGR03067 family)